MRFSIHLKNLFVNHSESPYLRFGISDRGVWV